MSDSVNHPKHYTSHKSGVECIDITEHLNFCIGNAMKYLWRVDDKGDPIENLQKAKWYIQRELDRRHALNHKKAMETFGTAEALKRMAEHG